MQIIYYGDNLHEVSILFSSKNKKIILMLSANIFT